MTEVGSFKIVCVYGSTISYLWSKRLEKGYACHYRAIYTAK